jgi:hypothetical protein
MGAVMFIPVVFCLHIVLICLYTFTGMCSHGHSMQHGSFVHPTGLGDTIQSVCTLKCVLWSSAFLAGRRPC